jgi:two-component system OmpR family response regulator
MAPPVHALIVEDDSGMRQMVSDYLTDNDMRVSALPDGRGIAELMARDIVDVLILDLKLPGEDGMQIARRVRGDSNVPIIMLTGRTEEADRVMGLELGADDYLTKPFSPRELLARIRALLRRARTQETVAQGMARVRAYRFAGWELNVRLHRLTAPDGKSVALTNAEFHLLGAFLAAPLRILSREQLLDASRLHSAEVYDRAIDVQVGRLRKKLEAACAHEPLIHTERGAGYVLRVAVDVVH